MAGLQELRKRLRSIRSTQQMAAAMRTGATAKFAKLSRKRTAFGPYSEACGEILAGLGEIGIVRRCEEVNPRACLVLLSGNRGFCGGFHAELFRFFEEEYAKEENPPLLLACGRKAVSFCRERGWEAEEYAVEDVPSFEEIRPIADRLREIYVSGEAETVSVICQDYENILRQTPGRHPVLPGKRSGGETEEPPLYLPDRETIGEQLAVYCLESEIYEIFLQSASGAQAATQMAMRSACDNAEDTASKLEITINRRRQAEVTAGVIETASGSFREQGE